MLSCEFLEQSKYERLNFAESDFSIHPSTSSGRKLNDSVVPTITYVLTSQRRDKSRRWLCHECLLGREC
jgi:hypothetical protein